MFRFFAFSPRTQRSQRTRRLHFRVLIDAMSHPPPDAQAAAPAPAIRELSAAPLEQGALAKAEADKDFGGEFYPTEVHHETPHISVTDIPL